MPDKMITVEVAYAQPHTQVIIPVQVAPESTAEQAIIASGILQKFPEIDLKINDIGIFSKQVRPDTVLRHKDRVEIYRALIADPKESRRQRADADKKA